MIGAVEINVLCDRDAMGGTEREAQCERIYSTLVDFNEDIAQCVAEAVEEAKDAGWLVKGELHLCPECVQARAEKEHGPAAGEKRQRTAALQDAGATGCLPLTGQDAGAI